MNFPFIFNTIKNFWGLKNILKGYIGEVYNLLPKDELPLKIQISKSITNDITYSVETHGNSWFEKYDFYFEDIKVYTKKGFLIWEKPWDVLEEEEYRFFKLLNSYKNTNGLVVGAHDGTFGEWITLVSDNKNKLILVEASEDQFKRLFNGYKDKNNIKLINSLVSTDGDDIIFYEGPSGFFNSTNLEHLKKYFSEDQIKKIPKSSISLIDLIDNNFEKNLDWIHLDTEGYDAKLILSLNNRKDLLPRLIVYEHNHLDLSDKHELEKFFYENSYQTIIFKDNTFALNENR